MARIYRGVDAMRALPIFKTEMRKANREGLKSQTRRVIKPQVEDKHWEKKMNHASIWSPKKELIRFCPYGKAGDVVYMRDPLFKGPFGFAHYVDDKTVAFNIVTGEPIRWRWKVNTLSGMFMPAEAARFIYQYKSIRVERVQEITRIDAKAEGMSNLWSWDEKRNAKHPEHFRRALLNPYIANYSVLWDEINCERGFGWDVNPWVWVLEYEPLPPSAFGTSPILEERQYGGGKAGAS